MSLLLDALKNAERAKASSAIQPAEHNEPIGGFADQSFEPARDPQPTGSLTDTESGLFADPSELLSDAALQLELGKEPFVEVQEEESETVIGSEFKETEFELEEVPAPEPLMTEEVEAEQRIQMEDQPVSEPVVADSQVLVGDLADSSSDISAETVPVSTADGQIHSKESTKLTLKSVDSDNARRILNAPNRPKNQYRLGLGLGVLLLFFALGAYFFYATTILPEPIVHSQFVDSNSVNQSAIVPDSSPVPEKLDTGQTTVVMKQPIVDKTLEVTKKTNPSSPVVKESFKTATRESMVGVDTMNDVEIVSNPIKIQKRRLPASLNNLLSNAYNSLQRSDFGTATRLYQKALKISPGNVDALLGMGSIKSQQKSPESARKYFEQALVQDASNVYAHSALTRLNRDKDPLESESRLKSLITQNDQSANLYFDLANLYAAQSRWVAAERAYYNAYNLDQSKPDYAFNLAISLDHLGKKKMASRFYETALSLAKRAPAQFDTQAAEQRLVQILGS